ncbi:MAG: hypothetical protein KAR20_00285 [Candidatus Heimdallarchaeota archaeon]|nr:hypothetical protein [Candidatus Heimdallarchaeota archaeon]
MSENEMQMLVNEFLKNVKEKLPEWLKDKKEDKEILSELEEHIWNKADELSGTRHSTPESVQSAIDHMGSPESIAREYKRRGTPKYYITEELWPYYKKVIAVVFGVIVGIVVVSQIVNLIFGNTGSFLEAISGMQWGFLAAFVAISVIFVALSFEGYLPEDFQTKKATEEVKTGTQISVKEKKPAKRIIKPAEDIIGGTIGIVFGMVLIIQPISTINAIIHPEFLVLLQIAGLFMITESGLELSRGLIGNRQIRAHQILHGVTIVAKLTSISVIILMMNRPDIFPILIVEEWGQPLVNIGIAPEFYGLFRGIAGLLIAIVALSTIENMYKIYKLETYTKLK